MMWWILVLHSIYFINFVVLNLLNCCIELKVKRTSLFYCGLLWHASGDANFVLLMGYDLKMMICSP